MNQEDFPILLHLAEEPLPIDILVFDQYEMRNVGAIVTVAILNKDLGTDEIRHGRDLYLVIKELRGLAVSEPVVGNRSHQIRRTEYEVDVNLAFEYLGDPALVVNLGLIAKRGKLIENFG